jgi:integrase
MAVYQRKTKGVHEGVWYYSLTVSGKRVQKSTGKMSRREAEKIAARALAEMERGEVEKPVSISLSELGQKYLAYAKTHKRSWVRDEQMLKQLREHFGDVRLGSISAIGVEEYQQRRIAKARPATVNREVALLKHMFNAAQKWELFRGANPVRWVKLLAEDNLKYRSISEDDESGLLGAASPYLRELMLFALNTGLRFGDMVKLRWEEVDRDAKRVSIYAEKTRRRLIVPLNVSASEIIERRWAAQHGPYVFWNPATGDRFYDLKLGFKAALKRAGLSGITWHTFRHTFATRLIARGVDLVTVKELLGHSTITVTMRYAHTNHAAKAQAVEVLGGSVKTVSIVPRNWKAAQSDVSASVSIGN